jgi:acyl-CoA reductase-like NAD-dependent aldehyde dehydrogenase
MTKDNDMDHSFSMLIDGHKAPGVGTFDVVNPATGQAFARCPKADVATLNAAVAAASRAFPDWASTPIETRGRAIALLGDHVEARLDEFARLLTAEQGKPLAQARMEIARAAETLRVFAAMRLEPRVLAADGGRTVIEYRGPLGVVAAITPWNYPVLLLVNKLAPALLAGNTLVLKPAPTTPLTTLLLGEICGEIFPAGVVNTLSDENDLGGALTTHPDIAKIAFTGSTATGKKVMAAAAAGLKRITLELGGNDAAIILDDVDPRTVARKVYASAMSNAGQICVATKRAYVPEALYDAFVDELAIQAKQAIVGDGSEQGTTMGPIQNKAQFTRLCALLGEAGRQGRVVAGGAPLDRPGYFIPPTIVADLPEDSALVREEQFGPVLPVLKYRDIDEVIARANASDYGLGGTVWGADLDAACDIARRIDSGTVWVNQYLTVDPRVPFRGAKQSGIGAELGEAGLHEYTQAHVVHAMPLEA